MENITKNKYGVTQHAAQRLLERTCCKQKNILRFVEHVWLSGKKITDYDRKSSMSSYLSNVKLVGGEDREIRVSGNDVYIFNKSGSSLITCYQIPQKVLQNKKKMERRI